MLDHNRTVPLRSGLWGVGMLGAGLLGALGLPGRGAAFLAIRSGRSRILQVRASSGSKGLPGQRTLSSCCSFRAGENLKEFPGTGGTTDLPGRTGAAGVQRPRIVDARDSLADLPGLEAVIPVIAEAAGMWDCPGTASSHLLQRCLLRGHGAVEEAVRVGQAPLRRRRGIPGDGCPSSPSRPGPPRGVGRA